MDTLVAMGFDASLAQAALTKAGGSVERAADLLLSGQITASDASTPTPTGRSLTEDKPEPTTVSTPMDTSDTPEATEDMTVRSLKCDDCGKMLRNIQEAEAHGARTKHTNFSQSTEEKKQLTPEEKEAQFRLLEQKMKEKKAEREKREFDENIAKEKTRRKEGQSKSDFRAEFEKKEMLKVAAERKREKLENIKAKERVKELIKQDRLKAQLEQGAVKATPAPAPVSVATPTVKKEYTTCRIQIRPPPSVGKAVTHAFDPNHTVASIFEHALANLPGLAGQSFQLVMLRPRKVFTESDGSTKIADSGLMPSAALTLELK
eukprot:m.152909 g.152909  ORF g.152909 m.152909 type:complete len:319 (+) comp30817_c3_seq1:208-1164(+)